MALDVEDGTGKATATSYLSVAEADAYFVLMGNADWASADAGDKETALFRATKALDSWLRGRWRGSKVTSTQALAWPRSDVVDEDGLDVLSTVVPTQVKEACAEIALIELTSSFIAKSVGAAQMPNSVSVGPVSISYKQGAPAVTKYPHVEALLSGLASTGGTMIDFTLGLTEDELNPPRSGSAVQAYFDSLKT